MKKILINYYLLATLALIAQAIFVVYSGNIAIATNLEITSLQAENDAINENIRLLQDKISYNNSSHALAETADYGQFVPIQDRLLVAPRSLASLE